MKNNLKEENLKQNKSKGITLIALIITIIVLIILAGVTIAGITGENGIIRRAIEARDKTGIAGLVEQVQMEILESLSKNEGEINKQDLYDILSKYFTNVPDVESEVWDTFPENFPKLKGKGDYEKYDDVKIGDIFKGTLSDTKVATTLKPGEKATTTKQYNYEDNNKEKATVPAGFKVSLEPDEQNVEDGLVIIDEQGNEFVWIPCTVTQYEEAKNAVMDEGWSCNNEYKDNGDDDWTGAAGGGDGRDWSDDYTEEDNTKIKEIYTEYDITTGWTMNQTTIAKKSIGDYGGFYIARYEAGVPADAPFYASNTSLSYNNINKENITSDNGSDGKAVRGSYNDSLEIKDLKPISKKGMQAWNYITQPNSKMVAENMYKGNEDVGSYLVDSESWNHICKNIFKNNKEGKDITNSETWGNYYNNKVKDYTSINGLYVKHTYSGGYAIASSYQKGIVPENTGINRVELGTGLSDEFKLYNIYDMAGNMWEWTTGHNIKKNQMFVAPRGGSFCSGGTTEPVVRANGGDVLSCCHFFVGFRVVLYVK